MFHSLTAVSVSFSNCLLKSASSPAENQAHFNGFSLGWIFNFNIRYHAWISFNTVHLASLCQYALINCAVDLVVLFN